MLGRSGWRDCAVVACTWLGVSGESVAQFPRFPTRPASTPPPVKHSEAAEKLPAATLAPPSPALDKPAPIRLPSTDATAGVIAPSQGRPAPVWQAPPPAPSKSPPQRPSAPNHGSAASPLALPVNSPIAARHVADYRAAAEQSALATDAELPSGPVEAIPRGFRTWWQAGVEKPMRRSTASRMLRLRELVLEAARNSHFVHAISQQPLIRETDILAARAEFDCKAFMESKFLKSSKPVGNSLLTGGPPRLRESDWTYIAGLRKKNVFGGSFEASQRIGYLDSNSLFFLPKAQGNATLTLSYEHPLLNGAGRAYNESLIVLAELDTAVAWDQTLKQLQQHLYDVAQAYWELHQQRATWLQMHQLFRQGEAILAELEQRQALDALQSQIVRARAATATRRADLFRAEAAIRNAEARLRALVNSATLAPQAADEIVVVDAPLYDFVPVTLRESLIAALEHRPEIDEAARQIDAAAIRLDVARNELLPVLNVVLSTYVTGLEGDTELARAFANQFTKGEPSYSAGLVFEMPLGNRAAFARSQRRELELRQLSHQFRSIVELLQAEVEVVVREVHTAYREIHAKYAAMSARHAEVTYLTERWRLLPGDDRSASFLLEDLLDAQDRYVTEQRGFVQAQVAYMLALTGVNRATGTLLQAERLIGRLHDGCGTPRIEFEPTGP